MRFGRMTAGASVATRNDTSKVIAGGYSSGAGSKFGGSWTGMDRDVWCLRYCQRMTRAG